MESKQVPHRPGHLHQTNKVHKSWKHNSRSRRKSSASREIISKLISSSDLQQSRNQRIQQLDQLRKLKKEKATEAKRKLGVDSQPPLLIGVIDLHLNQSARFIKELHNFEDKSVIDTLVLNERLSHVKSMRFKQRYTMLAIDSSKFDETIDIVKSLDIIVALHRCELMTIDLKHEIDQLFRAIRMNCLPTILHVLDASKHKLTIKDISQSKKLLRSQFDDEKIHVLEKDTDLLQLFHILSNCKRQQSMFKDSRAQLLSEKLEIDSDGLLSVTGFVRRKRLCANQLIHILGLDDYKIIKIEILPDPTSLRPSSCDPSYVIHTLKPDPMKQESLDQVNDLDPMMGEQNFPSAEDMAEFAKGHNIRKVLKKLPIGTSDYQGAWIEDSDNEEDLDDARLSSDCMSDIQEVENESDELTDMDDCQSGTNDKTDENDDTQDMDIDEHEMNFNQEKIDNILTKIKEARQNTIFPDEVDTPFNISARMRFARYRGLKSFRTSAWDPQENLPIDYSRIYQFQNFQATKKRAMSEIPDEGADPGQYVRIYLSDVPVDSLKTHLNLQSPLVLIGLLRHERKMTVLNLLIKCLPGINLKLPIKSKDELVFYVGYRKFKAKPIYSNHSASSKFKFERFIQDDTPIVATMYGPVTYPPAPVLVFREKANGQRLLLASGTVLDSNPNRLIIKRIRLAGHPFKIHSKTAVIRYMFFNSEDVMYFKPVELITRYGRRGHISEPIGTHGHMKCTFDKKIRSDDCVLMNLYKRVYPKWSYISINNV